MPWIVLSALALCAPSQLSRRDGHGALCTTWCKQEQSCMDKCAAGKEVAVDFSLVPGEPPNGGNLLKVAIGDRVKFTWTGTHDVRWMGDVSDCTTMTETDPIIPGFDSFPFTLFAYPAWDGAVVSFACGVGNGAHCEMGQKIQIQFGEKVDNKLSNTVCKTGAPGFNTGEWKTPNSQICDSKWPLGATDENDDGEPTLAGLVASVDSLSTLLSAVKIAGLAQTLTDAGTYTVFAPNNAAFEGVDATALAALLADPDQLKQVILNHVLAAQVLSTELKMGEQKVATASGGALWVTKTADGVTVANSDRSIVANVVGADNMANNGVAHIIDVVLLPPSTDGDGDATKTTAATTTVGNGNDENDDDFPTLAGLVTSVDSLSTLLTAVKAAGLAETLTNAGTYTVFAPNDAAFDKVNATALAALLADPVQLKEVIMYHVLASKILSTELKMGEQKVPTAGGGALWVTKTADGVTVANSDRSIVANVVGADNMANNGVAHIIDAVLFPPSTGGDGDATITTAATTTEKPRDVDGSTIALTWKSQCNTENVTGCPGKTGLSKTMEDAYVQHYKEFYFYLGQSQFSGEDAAKVVLPNPERDGLNYMDASGKAKWFGKKSDDDDFDERDVWKSMEAFFEANSPAGDGGTCQATGQCKLLSIADLDVRTLNAGLVLSTATLSFADNAGNPAGTIKSTMIAGYNGTVNGDAVYSPTKGSSTNTKVDSWHALSIWHESYDAATSTPMSVDDRNAIKETLVGYYDNAYLPEKKNNKCIEGIDEEGCNKAKLEALNANFDGKVGTAFQYVSADDGTYISASTGDFDSVASLMDTIDTDMRTKFNNVYFYPSPLTQSNINMVTENVVQMSQIGYYVNKPLSGSEKLVHAALNLLSRNLKEMLKDRQVTVHQDFFYAQDTDGKWRLIAMVTEEVKHIAVWPGMAGITTYNDAKEDDSNLGYVEKAALMFYLEETFGHFTRGEGYAAASVMMQQGLAIGARIPADAGFVDPSFFSMSPTGGTSKSQKFTNADDLGKMLSDVSARFGPGYSSILALPTVKRMAGGAVFLEAELRIVGRDNVPVTNFDLELIVTSQLLDSTKAKSWQILYMSISERAVGTPELQWNTPIAWQDVPEPCEVTATCDTPKATVDDRVATFVKTYVEKRNKALKANEDNKEKNFEDLFLGELGTIGVFENNGKVGVVGDATATPLAGSVALLNQMDAQRRAQLGNDYILHLDISAVTQSGDKTLIVTCIGGYSKVPANSAVDDDDVLAGLYKVEEHIELDFLLERGGADGASPWRIVAIVAESMLSAVTLTNGNATGFMHWSEDETAPAKAESAYTLHLDEFFGHLVNAQYESAAQAGKVPDHPLRLDRVDANGVSEVSFIETNGDYAAVLDDFMTLIGNPKAVKMDNMETYLSGGFLSNTGMSTITYGTVKFMDAAYVHGVEGTPTAVYDVWMVSVTPVKRGIESGNWLEASLTLRQRPSSDLSKPTYPVAPNDCSARRRREGDAGSNSTNSSSTTDDGDGDDAAAGNDDENDDAAAIGEMGQGTLDAQKVTCVPVNASTFNNPFGGVIDQADKVAMRAIAQNFVAARNTAVGKVTEDDVAVANRAVLNALKINKDLPFVRSMGGETFISKGMEDMIDYMTDSDMQPGVKIVSIDDSSEDVGFIRVAEGTFIIGQPWLLALNNGKTVEAFNSIVIQKSQAGELYTTHFFTNVDPSWRSAPTAAADGKKKGRGGRAFGYFILVCVILAGVGFGLRYAGVFGSGGAHKQMENDTSHVPQEFANPLAKGGEQATYVEPSAEDSSA